jgi:acetoin:2,6-dichlorophenolindophenol oxidoreductase subunit beta
MNTPAAASTRATPSTITGVQATQMALDEMMANDPNVLVFGEDVADPEGGGIFKATRGLSTKYGNERVRSTPISEQAIVGAAIGAAMAGKRPVAEIMLMNFSTIAMDMIFNHAAKLRFMSGGKTACPLVIRMMSGVGTGNGGQHSDFVEAWMCHTPGLKVVIPSNPADQYALLKSAIADDNPVIFCETIMIGRAQGPAPEPGYAVPLGKAKVVRSGTDVTIISYGRPMHDCISLAEKLHDESISVEVLDLRTIVPMDVAAIVTSVRKTGRAVIVHEAVTSFGVGAEIAARLHSELFDQLKAPVERVGSAYTPVPFSKPLERAYMWGPEKIEAAVRRTLSRSSRR